MPGNQALCLKFLPHVRDKAEYRSLSERIIDRLSVDDKDTVFWDRDLPGFEVRVYPSASKVYLVQTQAGGKSKRDTIGGHGLLSAEQVRRKAARLIPGINASEPLVLRMESLFGQRRTVKGGRSRRAGHSHQPTTK